MHKVAEIVKTTIVGLPENARASDAAKKMRDFDVGAVIVTDKGDQKRLVGIVTDRDIAVRAVAIGKDFKTTLLSEICSKTPSTLSPDDEIDRAVDAKRGDSPRTRRRRVGPSPGHRFPGRPGHRTRSTVSAGCDQRGLPQPLTACAEPHARTGASLRDMCPRSKGETSHEGSRISWSRGRAPR